MLQKILSSLQNHQMEILNDVNILSSISKTAVGLIDSQLWSQEDIDKADIIIRISNIAYNNTSKAVLPLDDGVYDQLLVKYIPYNPNYQVGAKHNVV